ncbi:MAG: Formyltetrahydrofolate deformylase, partial [uncultured Solirubrobacteraceae bacterium]
DATQQHPRHRAAARLLSRQAGDHRGRGELPARAGRQHRRVRPVLDRSRGRRLLSAHGLPPGGPLGDPPRRRAPLRSGGGRALLHELELHGGGSPQARGDHGQPLRPLPAGPAVASAAPGARSRHRARDLQPPRPRRAGARLRRAVRPHPGDCGLKARRRAPPDRAAARQLRSHHPRALHADPVGAVPGGRRRAGHQHPPLVSARLRGRRAVRARQGARREAHRRDGALRDRGPRRGADHRAGRHPRHASQQRRGARAPGRRRRTHGARARGAVALRGPRAEAWRAHRRVL